MQEVVIIMYTTLYEGLGRHKRKNGMTGCTLCGDECESVVYVLWEYPAYKNSREEFLVRPGAILVVLF